MTAVRRLPGPAGSRLAILLTVEDDICVLRLEGKLDLSTVDHLRRGIRSVVADVNPRRLLLDLSGLGFTDSTGLATLVWAHKAMSVRSAELELLHPQPLVCRLLRITGLDTRLRITYAPPSPATPAEVPDRQ